MKTAPTIMVSSTFFDLSQVRKDLLIFISDNLGFIPLLSELPSFPVEPDIDTINNCRRRVEKDADIMVLIIGGRYGSIDTKTIKSITNLEFLEARAKGIPIYVFIAKSMLTVFPLWKANPTIDFSAVVDTPKLFEFIEYIRNEERVWTFEFETAQDIIQTLRTQFAYLFQDSLQVKMLLSGFGIPSFMEELRPKTLRIALEKPQGWEYFLFFQTWIDEIDRRANIIKAYKAGLNLEPAIYIPSTTVFQWILTQMQGLNNLVDSANQLINDSIQEGFGKPGEPGDPERIIWVSQMIGCVLEKTLIWANTIRCSRCDPPFDQIIPELALFADDLISQFDTFPNEAIKKIEDALKMPKSEKPHELKLTLQLTLANEDGFMKTLENIKEQYGIE
jgi:hypothetical protein